MVGYVGGCRPNDYTGRAKGAPHAGADVHAYLFIVEKPPKIFPRFLQ